MMRAVNTDKRTRICIDLTLAILLAGVFVMAASYIYLNLFCYTSGMDADIGGEALLSRAIWESGSLVPESWIASTETRILSIPALASFFYGMTGSMTLAMGIACSIGMLLLLALYAVFMRTAGLTWLPVAGGILALFAVVGSTRHAQLLFLQADYYTPCVCIMLITLSVYLRLTAGACRTASTRDSAGCNKTSGQEVLLTLICLLLAYLLSMSGMRGMLVIYVPLAATECLLWIIFAVDHGRTGHGIPRERVRGAWFALGCIAAAYFGTQSPYSVDTGASRNIRHGLEKLTTVVLPDVLDCLGLDSGWTLAGVITMLLLLASAVLLFMGFVDSTFRLKDENTRSDKSGGDVAWYRLI